VILNFSYLFFTILLGLPLLRHLLTLQFFLPLDDLLEFFFGFWSSSCASCVLDLKFKLCVFCCQCTHQGGLINQVISTLI
jgi:hypothetical protein